MNAQVRHYDRQKLIGVAVGITQWANDRFIIMPENANGQFMKLVSEWGEVNEGVILCDSAKTKDGIGDTFVMLNNVAAILGGDICGLMLSNPDVSPRQDLANFTFRLGLLADFVAKKQNDKALSELGLMANDLAEISCALGWPLDVCAEYAYNDIKDRKGVMYNGVFIKESDERYESAVAELRAAKIRSNANV